VLDPNPPVLYSCGRGAAPNLEPRLDAFGVEQLYPNDPTIANSAAISFLTVVNGSHAWPLTGGDPTGRRLVTHEIDWTKRVVSFWNTYAGMGLVSPPAWTRC
jgi:poly(3-hydroxybutyrate) depolymerase